MRRTTAALGLLVTVVSVSPAATTPEVVCEQAKLDAAGKKVAGKMACHGGRYGIPGQRDVSRAARDEVRAALRGGRKRLPRHR